jgi:hypothetical protein
VVNLLLLGYTGRGVTGSESNPGLDITSQLVRIEPRTLIHMNLLSATKKLPVANDFANFM